MAILNIVVDNTSKILAEKYKLITEEINTLSELIQFCKPKSQNIFIKWLENDKEVDFAGEKYDLNDTLNEEIDDIADHLQTEDSEQRIGPEDALEQARELLFYNTQLDWTQYWATEGKELYKSLQNKNKLNLDV